MLRKKDKQNIPSQKKETCSSGSKQKTLKKSPTIYHYEEKQAKFMRRQW